MSKFKKLFYVLMLLACIIASPMVMINVWKSSEEIEKNKDVAPPSIIKEKSVEVSVIPNETEPEAESIEAPTEIPTEPPVEFITSAYNYFDDALFIGDSRTVGIRDYGLFKNSDYFCDIGLTAEKVPEVWIDDISFDYLIDSKQYRKVYIMLGINEIGEDMDYIFQKYRAIVEKVKVHQPDALIFIQANLHVTAEKENYPITNSRINEFNNLISELADGKWVFYIDVNEVFDDENGCLTEDYTGDGVHVLSKYYEDWCKWLCTKTIPAKKSDTSTEQNET